MGIFLQRPRGCMNTWLFLSKLMGIARRGWRYEILKQFGQHVNEMMAVAVNSILEFLMVTFSYNQTKR